MTAQKHLRDLLSEEQEPFVLENYIAEHRRCYFSRRNQATTTSRAVAVKELKPTLSQSSNSFSGSNLCKSVCFSFQESPDTRQSPVPEFAPPHKTNALLLELASRIQQKTTIASAPMKRSFFGSILKSLTLRNRRHRPEIDIDLPQKLTGVMKKSSSIGCTGHSRRSSAWWSESNGERTLGDLEESTSGSDDADERASTVSDGREDWEFALLDGQLCKSPFRFSLRRSPTPSANRSPDSSPAVAASLVLRGKEETRTAYDVDSPKKLEGSDEPQHDKEQCSPMSVLDPDPFEDDVREDELEDIDVRNREFNCSYANVQRVKHQLLEKLYRFEKLSELDPVELEKRMLEQDSDDGDFDEDEEMTVEDFSKEVMKLRFGHMMKIPIDLRNLVSDLISDEWRKADGSEDRESLMKRVCGKLESWKEVESDTIDMMVEEDFRRSEIGGWKQIDEQQFGEIVLQIEVSIFGSLATEFFHM